MSPKQALIQADLDYQRADIDQKIQHYVATSQGHSAKLDSAFIMGIEIGLSILVFVQIIQSFNFQLQVWQMCLHKRDCWLEWNWCSYP